jgi:hypothetical protein
MPRTKNTRKRNAGDMLAPVNEEATIQGWNAVNAGGR